MVMSIKRARIEIIVTVLKFAQAVVLLNFHYKVDFVISNT